MSKIKFDSYSVFQILSSLIVLTLFFSIFFPQARIVVLAAVSAAIIGLLIFVTNKIKDKQPLRLIPIKQRYRHEKVAIGFVALFLDIASLTMGSVIVMFFLEQNKDRFDYIVIVIVGALGLLCLYFGAILTRVYWIRYRSFEAYRKMSLEDELGELKPSDN